MSDSMTKKIETIIGVLTIVIGIIIIGLAIMSYGYPKFSEVTPETLMALILGFITICLAVHILAKYEQKKNI